MKGWGGGNLAPHSMKVFFATPAYRGIQCPQFLDSLEKTVNLCHEQGIETVFTILPGCCYVQVARNELVYRFLESDADVLFFLDDDISWPAEAVLRLLRMPDDIVAGIYPLKVDPPNFPVVIHLDENDIPVHRTDGSIKAASVPTGFLKITRNALKRLIAHFPDRKYSVMEEDKPVRELYDLFPQGVYNGRWWGEDFAFCRLWRELGDIWIVPDITFHHHAADKTWAGNYREYLLTHER